MPRAVYDKTTRVQLKDIVESCNLQQEEDTTARELQSQAVSSPKLKSGIIVHLVQAITNTPSRTSHLLTNSLTIFSSGSPLRGGRHHEPSTNSVPICEIAKLDTARQELAEDKSYWNEYDDPNSVDSACSRTIENWYFSTSFR